MERLFCPHQVKMSEIAIYNMGYSIALPVDHVFTAVSKLKDLAEHANTPMSEPLLVTALAYVVLSKELMFQPDFHTWLLSPEAEQTWANMLQHFRIAQNYLSCMPTAGDHYNHCNHHANAAIVADLVTQRLLEAIPPSITDNPLALPPDLANAAHYQQNDSTLGSTRDAALLASMQEMMALMRSNHSNINPSATSTVGDMRY